MFAVARDVPRVAVYGGDNSAFIFDGATRRLLKKIRLTGFADLAIALSPNGKILATTPAEPPANRTIDLWHVATGKHAGTLVGNPQPVRAMCFSADGAKLFSGGIGAIRAWDVVTRKALHEFPASGFGLTLSPDGKKLASYGGETQTVAIWSTATHKLLHALPDCGGTVDAVAFSPDSKTIVTGGSLHSLRFWEIATGKEVHSRPGHHSAVVAIQFSPDGKRLASRGADQTARVWSIRSHVELHVLSLGKTDSYRPYVAQQPTPSTSLAWSPDGSRLAAVGGLGLQGMPSPAVLLWDAADFTKEPLQLRDPAFPPLSVACSADGSRLLTARMTLGGVRVWSPEGDMLDDLKDPDPEERHPGEFRSPTDAVALSPDGRFLAVAGRAKVLLWDYPTRTHIRSFARLDRKKRTGPEGLFAGSVVFSPTSDLLAVVHSGRDFAGSAAHVCLHDPHAGTRVATLSHKAEGSPDRGVHAAAFSPDGRLLAMAIGPLVHVRDVHTGKHLAAFEGHRSDALCVAFSPDGRTLASGGMDTTILLWDVSRIRPSLPTPGPAAALAARLAGDDAALAFASLAPLAAHGDAAIKHLPKLAPVPRLDRAAARALIAGLDADDEKTRDGAMAALVKMGRPAEGLYRELLVGKLSSEARLRIQRLLERITGKPDPDAIIRERALRVLELAGTPAARALLMRLSAGEPGAPLTRQALAAVGRLTKRASP